MEDLVDEFEPLFDYSRMQPAEFVDLEDDNMDLEEIFGMKRKNGSKSAVVPALEEDVVEVSKVVVAEEKEEDWLPPPPKKPSVNGVLSNDSTLEALRLKKQELASLAMSAKDILREAEISYKKSVRDAAKHGQEDEEGKEPVLQVKRDKIVLSIQDKDVVKQFRIYMDDKFEKLFKMYAEKVKIDFEKLVFSFDGDKVSPTATPAGMAMENEDIIEVRCKPN